MKSTGIVRKIDHLGRLVVPVELRKTMGIEVSDPMEFYTNGDQIVVKKYKPGCHVCGEISAEVSYFYGQTICKKCVKEIAKYASRIIEDEKMEE